MKKNKEAINKNNNQGHTQNRVSGSSRKSANRVSVTYENIFDASYDNGYELQE